MTRATHTSRNARRAFSLVELLIVIGVIGFLAVGFFVFLAPDTRERAREVSCASNVQQICPTAPWREPAGPADVPTDYFFVPDLALDDRVSSVATGDDDARHRGGGNIGYLGCYVKRHDADEWRRLAGPHLPPAPAEAEGD